MDYVYDLVGKVMQVNDPTGTYGFAYDNVGALDRNQHAVLIPAGCDVQHGVHLRRSPKPNGLCGTGRHHECHQYDTLNRLSTLTNSLTGQFGFSYDALSRRTQLTQPNGINTNYTYDSVSRLLSLLHQAGNTIIDGASYTYDLAGNRTSKTNYLNNVTEGYAYDSIYQLLQVTQGASTTESYTYDRVGNRLSSLGLSPYMHNSSNQVTSTPNATYTYDYNGKLSCQDGRCGNDAIRVGF